MVDDFIDELYAFDINNWADSLEKILQMLNFPVKIDYCCGWKEFLYERTGRLRYFAGDDRKTLTECREIAVFRLGGNFRKLNFIAVRFTGNLCTRNETVYDVYRLFRKIYGRYVLFVACYGRDIAFAGTSIDQQKNSEVIISDWFGENVNREIMNRILEIDFSLFSYTNLSELYKDYIWAIARPYVKYRESKMYMIFECGQAEFYEAFAADPDSDEVIPMIKVDREETYKINAAYYPDIYGDDYFIDESGTEDDTPDMLNEDDAEFEWTMLEMELATEDIENDDYDEELDSSDGEYDLEYEDDYDELSGMNPEEMLIYIRGNPVN